jgi:hypothetical protein
MPTTAKNYEPRQKKMMKHANHGKKLMNHAKNDDSRQKIMDYSKKK